jgi:diguanylate cyclase (GGDEF)-like protein
VLISAKLFHSFKFQITCLVTGLVMAASVCVGGIAMLITEAEMRDVLARQEASLVASMANQLDTDLEDKQQLLLTIAEEARSRQVAASHIQQLLEGHTTLRDEFFNVTAFDANGKLIANLNNRALAKLNISERPYFQQTMSTREGVISAPFKSMISGKPVVAVTQPIVDESGKIIVVLVGAIDLLRPSLASLQMPHDSQGYLFIVDDEGWVIHHPDRSRILQKDAIDAGFVEAIKSGNVQGSRDDLFDDGIPALLTFAHLRHANWTIASSYPIRSAFAPMLAVRARVFGAIGGFVALAAIFAWLLIAALLKPLRKLHDDVQRFAGGDMNAEVFNVKRRDEFGVLSRAIYTLQRHREQAEQALYAQANTDVLTSLNNRRMFEKFLPTAIARAQRGRSIVAVAFLDVDKFKAINDTYGHAVGDAVLVEFAKRISSAVRITDTVARLAGDEFVIVYEQLKSAEEARTLGEKILAAIASPFMVSGLALSVTSSVGIAVTSDAIDADALMAAADDALYGVKAAGRNGFAVNYLGWRGAPATVHGVHKHGQAKVSQRHVPRLRNLVKDI